jgi:hypothetical protein
MEPAGARAEPAPGVDPVAAFFGLWPRIAEPHGPAPPLARVIAHEPPRLRIA